MLKLLRRARSEQGGVTIAVLAVTVVSLSVVTLASTVQNGLTTARTDQNRINAFQHANAGIDRALYRIDRGDTSGTTPIAGGFRDTVTVDGSTYEVEAVQTFPGYQHSWTVRSTGADESGRARKAIATVSTPSLFEHGFFTLQRFYLKGNQGTPVAYDSRVCPAALATCELPNPVPGRIGTNADIVLASSTAEQFINRWAGFDLYGRATQEAADAACDEGNCGTFPKVQAFPNQKEFNVPALPAGAAACPQGGRIDGGVIEPGDYVCQSLDLDGTITIGTGGNGSGKVRIWLQGPFRAAGGTVANQGQRTTKLQLFQDLTPAGGSWNGSICGAELWALLYTPGLTIDCEGSHQPTLYGAVLANIHLGNGNHFDFHWDISATEVLSDEGYTVSNWRECPVSDDDC